MANYEDTLRTSALNTVADRGLSLPSSPGVGITPPGSPQGDYAAGTPPRSNITPELQKVIDQVTKYATAPMPGGATASQGAALRDVMGQVGGVQAQQRKEAAEMARLGITGEREAEKMKMAGGFEERRLGIEQQKVDVDRAKVRTPAPTYVQKQLQSNTPGGGEPISGGTRKEIEAYLDNILKF